MKEIGRTSNQDVEIRVLEDENGKRHYQARKKLRWYYYVGLVCLVLYSLMQLAETYWKN